MKAYELKLTVVVNVDDARSLDDVGPDVVRALSLLLPATYARVDAVTELQPMQVELQLDEVEVHQ